VRTAILSAGGHTVAAWSPRRSYFNPAKSPRDISSTAYDSQGMAGLGFALYEAHIGGASVESIGQRLDLPVEWVAERIEAARLCLVLAHAYYEFGRNYLG
jgi:hypothetical protein